MGCLTVFKPLLLKYKPFGHVYLLPLTFDFSVQSEAWKKNIRTPDFQIYRGVYIASALFAVQSGMFYRRIKTNV